MAMTETSISASEHCDHCTGAGQEAAHRVHEIVHAYDGMQGALIMILHDVQDTFGYLPESALQMVSASLGLSMSEVFGVATFYSYFSLEPKGDHVVRVCLGTACYVRGSKAILDEVSKQLDTPVGKTTADGRFTVEAGRCFGACGLAPVLVVGDDVHGKLSLSQIEDVLQQYR